MCDCETWTWWRLGYMFILLAAVGVGLVGWPPPGVRGSAELVVVALLLAVVGAGLGWWHYGMHAGRDEQSDRRSARVTILALLALLVVALAATQIVFPRLPDAELIAVANALRTGLWLVSCAAWFFMAAVSARAAMDLARRH